MIMISNQHLISIKMTVSRRPAAVVESFINQAPDAQPASERMSNGKQAQISLAMPLELLDKVDAAARALNLSRAGYIKMCLSTAVKE